MNELMKIRYPQKNFSLFAIFFLEKFCKIFILVTKWLEHFQGMQVMIPFLLKQTYLGSPIILKYNQVQHFISLSKQ